MLPILKLANLYSEEKLQRKYPCLTSDSILIENLFYEYLRNLRYFDSFYDTLKNTFYEANEIIFEWQQSDDVPAPDPLYAQILSENITVRENIYWKSECDPDTAVAILRDVQPLWSALLAHKIDNETLDEDQFKVFVDDMYAFMSSRSDEPLKYPYEMKLSPVNLTGVVDTSPPEKIPEPLKEEKVPTQKERRRGRTYLWIAVLLGAALLAGGYFFFESGTFKKYAKQTKSNVPPTFENILVDSSEANKLVLYSTLNDSEVVILPNERPYLNKIYNQDSFTIGSVDSLDHLRGLFSIPKLDPSIYYEVTMVTSDFQQFKNFYPDLVFLYKPETLTDQPINIKLKKTK